mgnify:FL=1
MDYTKKRIAAQRLSEELWEKTGRFFSPTEIINIVESATYESPKEIIFTLQSAPKFTKEMKVAKTRHAKYGNTFLK